MRTVKMSEAIAHIIKTPALNEIALPLAKATSDLSKSSYERAFAAAEFDCFFEGVRRLMQMSEPEIKAEVKYVWRNGARVKATA